MNAFLTCSWIFLRSNTLEQLEFKLKKRNGIYKPTCKVRKESNKILEYNILIIIDLIIICFILGQVRQEDPENVLVSSLAYLTRTKALYGGDLEAVVTIMRTVASRIQYRLQSSSNFHDKVCKKFDFIIQKQSKEGQDAEEFPKSLADLTFDNEFYFYYVLDARI